MIWWLFGRVISTIRPDNEIYISSPHFLLLFISFYNVILLSRQRRTTILGMRYSIRMQLPRNRAARDNEMAKHPERKNERNEYHLPFPDSLLNSPSFVGHYFPHYTATTIAPCSLLQYYNSYSQNSCVAAVDRRICPSSVIISSTDNVCLSTSDAMRPIGRW